MKGLLVFCIIALALLWGIGACLMSLWRIQPRGIVPLEVWEHSTVVCSGEGSRLLSCTYYRRLPTSPSHCEGRTSSHSFGVGESVQVLEAAAHAPSEFPVLLVHGYRQSAFDMLPYAELFPRSVVYALDCRASGESSGTLTTLGLREWEEITAVARIIAEKEGVLPLILGVSMGAAASLRAAVYAAERGEQPLAAGLILDSSYASLYDLFNERRSRMGFAMRMIPAGVFLRILCLLSGQPRDSFRDSESLIGLCALPIALFHSQGDRFIREHHGDRLLAACSHLPTVLHWRGPAARHARLYETHPHLYAAEVERFISHVRTLRTISD